MPNLMDVGVSKLRSFWACFLLHSHITPPLNAQIIMVKWRNCEAQAKGKVKGMQEMITKRSEKVDKKSYNFNLCLELALN